MAEIIVDNIIPSPPSLSCHKQLKLSLEENQQLAREGLEIKARSIKLQLARISIKRKRGQKCNTQQNFSQLSITSIFLVWAYMFSCWHSICIFNLCILLIPNFTATSFKLSPSDGQRPRISFVTQLKPPPFHLCSRAVSFSIYLAFSKARCRNKSPNNKMPIKLFRILILMTILMAMMTIVGGSRCKLQITGQV